MPEQRSSAVITGRRLTSLESNPRSLYALANLAPDGSSAQVEFQTPTAMGGNQTISFNRRSVSHALYLIDGGRGCRQVQRSLEARYKSPARGTHGGGPVGSDKTPEPLLEKDPDRRVQQAITLVFEKRLELGSVKLSWDMHVLRF